MLTAAHAMESAVHVNKNFVKKKHLRGNQLVLSTMRTLELLSVMLTRVDYTTIHPLHSWVPAEVLFLLCF